jgi:tetratricopeptide (TPR) repeat protein
LANYYQPKDISTAINFCEKAVSLASSTRNTKMHSHALLSLAWNNCICGQYLTAQFHSYEAQRLARISADLFQEAAVLHNGAISGIELGNYKQSSSFCDTARELLSLCGMSSSNLDHVIIGTQAEIHRAKSEYLEAHSIRTKNLQDNFLTQDLCNYAFALLSVAEIDVSIGVPKDDVQRSCDTARKIFNTAGRVAEVTMCDMILADLYLREGSLLAAKTLFRKCIKISLGRSEIISYCLERLGCGSHWGAHDQMSSWTVVFLVHSLWQKKKLGIHRALQFLGEIFLAQDDEPTAISLFTVALEGFTYMDVHRSRAECMLQLGDISKGQGDLLKAVKLWESARPLFERSSQTKQVHHVDERLAGVGEDVLHQYRKNLACLAELNVPSVTVGDVDNESDIEDMEVLNLDDEKESDFVAV